MSTDPVETFKHAGLTVRIEIDQDPESPRDWDNLGTITCWHHHYDLGESHSFTDRESFLLSLLSTETCDMLERLNKRIDSEVYAATTGIPYGSDSYMRVARPIFDKYTDRLRAEAEKVAIILPLYLYDHSGITISCSPFSCPWDSGQVGFVWVSMDDVRKEYSCRAVTKTIREKAIKCLQQEIETYDEYLTGQVYGYVVKDEDGEDLDSCWGFYGLEYCRTEARGQAEYQANLIAEEGQECEEVESRA